MKILYLDCFAGISGDMMVGGLLDLGVDIEGLRGALEGLALSGYEIRSDKVERHGITATRFIVDVEERNHPHRPFLEIKEMIEGSSLNKGVKKRSLGIFGKLAEAEGRIHGIPPEEVSFHEVGGVDSIIDIIGASIALDCLSIEHIYSSPLPLGSGFVETAHGRLPIPAPATLELLKGYSVLPSGIQAELTTPTGAALIAHLSRGAMPPMEIRAAGYGAGSREFKEMPNLLRVILGETSSVEHRDRDASHINLERLSVIECNIDDMNPLVYEHVIERLFDKGALDVTLTPIQMKRNRPGILLSTLCEMKKREGIIEVLFSETTTIGLKVYEVERYSLLKKIDEFDSPYGKVRVKVSGSGGTLHIQPEYRDCKRIADEKGIPLRNVIEAVVEAYRELKIED